MKRQTRVTDTDGETSYVERENIVEVQLGPLIFCSVPLEMERQSTGTTYNSQPDRQTYREGGMVD